MLRTSLVDQVHLATDDTWRTQREWEKPLYITKAEGIYFFDEGIEVLDEVLEIADEKMEE